MSNSELPKSISELIPARINIIETVYYQKTNEQPIAVETRCKRLLECDEQPYNRRLTVSNKWIKLDSGWIKNAGLVVIKNHEGEQYRVNLNKEQKKAIAGNVLEVSFNSIIIADLLIHPGDSLRICPTDLDNISICAAKDDIKISITILPE